MPDLGPYRNDPRVKVRSDVLIQTTHGPEIRIGGEFFRVWTHGHTEPVYETRSLRAALRYVLGAVRTVGPDNMGGWLHTDGYTYLHDPATSGYKSVDQIRPGDVIAYAAHPEVEVLDRDQFHADFFGRRMNGFKVRRLSDGVEGLVPFGADGRFPVKFKD